MANAVVWRDLTLSRATGHRIVSIEGWESLPPNRYDKIPRARGHGAHPSPVWADERLITVTGTSYSVADRDQLLLNLMRRMSLDEREEPLAITTAGRTLTAAAQLLRADPVISAGSWNVGLIKWVAQWRCTDPLRYGPEQSLDTGLPTSGGGLSWPAFGGAGGTLDWGTPGVTGQLTLTNPGTAAAAIVLDVQAGSANGLQKGWEVSAAGKRLTYPAAVPPGQLIEVDTGAGSVLAERTADRRGELTRADWLLIPAAIPATGRPGSLTLQFTSLGGPYDPGTRLYARWKETNW